MSRPRPVLIYTAFLAGSSALLGFAGLADLMPKAVIAGVALIVAIVGAAGGVIVQGQVTPLSSPRNEEGQRLVPATSGAPEPRRFDR
jgi:hypothetical protein